MSAPKSLAAEVRATVGAEEFELSNLEGSQVTDLVYAVRVPGYIPQLTSTTSRCTTKGRSSASTAFLSQDSTRGVMGLRIASGSSPGALFGWTVCLQPWCCAGDLNSHRSPHIPSHLL